MRVYARVRARTHTHTHTPEIISEAGRSMLAAGTLLASGVTRFIEFSSFQRQQEPQTCWVGQGALFPLLPPLLRMSQSQS